MRVRQLTGSVSRPYYYDDVPASFPQDITPAPRPSAAASLPLIRFTPRSVPASIVPASLPPNRFRMARPTRPVLQVRRM